MGYKSKFEKMNRETGIIYGELMALRRKYNLVLRVAMDFLESVQRKTKDSPEEQVNVLDEINGFTARLLDAVEDRADGEAPVEEPQEAGE